MLENAKFHLSAWETYYPELQPRILHSFPLGMYCVHEKGANFKDGIHTFIVPIDIHCGRELTISGALNDAKQMTPGIDTITMYVLGANHPASNRQCYLPLAPDLTSLDAMTDSAITYLPRIDLSRYTAPLSYLFKALDLPQLSPTVTPPAYPKYLDLPLQYNQETRHLTIDRDIAEDWVAANEISLTSESHINQDINNIAGKRILAALKLSKA